MKRELEIEKELEDVSVCFALLCFYFCDVMNTGDFRHVSTCAFMNVFTYMYV